MAMDPRDRSQIDLQAIHARLEVEYPCRWLYKVIGTSRDQLQGAVLEVIQGADFTVEVSNVSSAGRYVSLNVEVTVYDEQQRIGIYEALRGHPHVRMVL